MVFRRSLIPVLAIAAVASAGSVTIPLPGGLRDLSRSSSSDFGVPDAPGRFHFAAKFSGPLGVVLRRALRARGIRLVTPLGPDSAIVEADSDSIERSPDVAWAGLLQPQDKAPSEVFSAPAGARLSILGHPGSRRAALEAEAEASGLRVRGGFDSPSGARIDVESARDRSAIARFLASDDVFAAFPARPPRLANDRSVGTIQSGVPLGPTPIFDHGVYGEGERIAILDTGLDVDSCYFSDSVAFPVNQIGTGSAYGTESSDAHRKIAAYDFLHPCGAFAPPCDAPGNPRDYDDAGHGTHVAGNAAGDNAVHLLLHDPGDGMAPGAHLIIQDGGYAPSDPVCGDLPGLGCAPGGLTPILNQAYAQGARIHSDSWADDSSGAPPANSGYSMSARDVDAFVFDHPDFLMLFVAGNSGAAGPLSVPSPGNAKNVVCVGSTRDSEDDSDENLSSFSGIGPAADGRVKPDIVAPGVNISASSDFSIYTNNCGTAVGAGTSYATPIAAGGAALAREYFDRGFYPGGVADPEAAFSPSAALLKAALVASADSLAGRRAGSPVEPAPSNEQGFGRIDLSHVLAFSDSAFRLFVVDRTAAFSPDSIDPAVFEVTVRSGGVPFRAVLVWTDPPGVPRLAGDSTRELVNDLDLLVTLPSGVLRTGNDVLSGGLSAVEPDRTNTVERIDVAAPAPGVYQISVVPHLLGSDLPSGFALVVTGDLSFASEGGLAVDADSATLLSDSNGNGEVDGCESLTARFRIVNTRDEASGPLALDIAPLDSALEVTAAPQQLPSLPPSGSIEVAFAFTASSNGIPLVCGFPAPFLVTVSAPDGHLASARIEFPAAQSPPGCGDVAALTCGPPQGRPLRLP